MRRTRIDTGRVLTAAAQAAVEDAVAQQRARRRSRRRRLPAARALLIGAGAVTAGRLAARGRGRALLGSLGDRLADIEARLGGEEPEAPAVDEEEAEDPGPEA